MLRHILRRLPLGWKQRLRVHLGVPDVRWTLSQLRRYGFSPGPVMDVGAFKGDWARICMDVFPSSSVTCVEPQERAQECLHRLAAAHPRMKVIQTLLGRAVKEVPFQEVGSGSSVWLEGPSDSKRAMTTIDTLIESGSCRRPELLKLDVQGYEMEVLEGFTTYFNECQVLQIEMSLMPVVKGTPLINEIMAYLHTRGFVMFDITGLYRSTSDGALWQMDAFFCHIDSPLRLNHVWESLPSGAKAFSEW